MSGYARPDGEQLESITSRDFRRRHGQLDEAPANPPWSCTTDGVTFPGCGTCDPCRGALARGWRALAEES